MLTFVNPNYIFVCCPVCQMPNSHTLTFLINTGVCCPQMLTFVINTGVCGCCPVCAKQEGEECGGDLAYRGKCDRDLDCVLTTKTIISSSLTLHNEPVGTCRKSKSLLHSCRYVFILTLILSSLNFLNPLSILSFNSKMSLTVSQF